MTYYIKLKEVAPSTDFEWPDGWTGWSALCEECGAKSTRFWNDRGTAFRDVLDPLDSICHKNKCPRVTPANEVECHKLTIEGIKAKLKHLVDKNMVCASEAGLRGMGKRVKEACFLSHVYSDLLTWIEENDHQ